MMGGMDFQTESTILVTCGPGLAPWLESELADLGYARTGSHKGGVELKGTLTDAMRLNLHLRTAYNVLYLLKAFRCAGPDELYRQVAAVAWEDIIAPDGYLSVISRVDDPTIKNTMFANLKVKDAIVDRIFRQSGRRPDSGKDRHRVVVNLYWSKGRAWLYLNTSGVKLSDRGYRKLPYQAPLRESLAAGILMATGYDGQRPLVLPMCGSGTLAIEAALMGLGRSPGLLRGNFAFLHVKGFDDDVWQQWRREARKAGKKILPGPIVATDIAAEAIEAARKNALTAGVDQLIEFRQCDFADTDVPPGEGLVLLNPEYGERLGQVSELEQTYKRIGDWFKQSCAGYRGYIFTGNPALAKKVGLRTSRRIEFFNGDIECRLLEYELYAGKR